MKLTELFDKKHDLDFKSSADRMTAKININDRDIDLRVSEDEPGIWEFAFYEKGATRPTGSGGAIEVFATVKQFLTAFIEQYHPEKIFFSAASEKQLNFYSKLMKTNMKFQGYKNTEDKNAGHFWITKT